MQLAVSENLSHNFFKLKGGSVWSLITLGDVMRTSLGNTGEGRYTVYTLDLRVNLHLLKIW